MNPNFQILEKCYSDFGGGGTFVQIWKTINSTQMGRGGASSQNVEKLYCMIPHSEGLTLTINKYIIKIIY